PLVIFDFSWHRLHRHLHSFPTRRSSDLRIIACVFLCFYGPALVAQVERPPEKNPLTGDPEAVAAGNKLYDEACQICHGGDARGGDRKSTRLNSSHGSISYAVFCLKKKKE